MSRFWSLLPITGLLCLTTACTQPQPPAPDTRAADERAIRDLEIEWSKMMAAKDVERVVSYYADDASLFELNAPIATGTAAIRASFTKLFAMPGVSLNFQTVKVEVARGGDLAYSHGTYTFSMDGPKGKPVNDKGKYVTVYRKQAGGQWKAVADINNSDLPMK